MYASIMKFPIRNLLGIMLLSTCSEGHGAVLTSSVFLNAVGANSLQVSVFPTILADNTTLVYNISLDGSLTATLGDFSMLLANGGAFYEVSEGDIIDPSLVLNGAPLAKLLGSFESVQTALTADFGETFFIGFMVDVAPYDRIPTTADAYGWAKLQNNGELVLLESAVSDGFGIRAGQFATIPEPGTILLLLLGGTGISLLRRPRKPRLAKAGN
jgi:hypothetical protein